MLAAYLRGLLPRPDGYAGGATYSEAHFVRAVAIGRMRAQGTHIDVITAEIEGWTDSDFERYVAKTAPRPEPEPVPPPVEATPPPAPPPAPEPPLAAAEDIPPGLPRDGVAGRRLPAVVLPRAPSYRVYALMRGVVLMVDPDSSPLAQRVAAEILETYGDVPRD